MAREPRILPYLDMPMQHASDAVLARMRRPERQRTIRDRVRTIRDVVPDIAIRTTCIVGFPGETDDDFEQLLAFLEEIQFERVGAFTYSPQEGTRAAEMVDDVPEAVKRERLERLQRAAAADHGRAVRAAHRAHGARDGRSRRSTATAQARTVVAGRRHRRRDVRRRRGVARAGHDRRRRVIEGVVDDVDFQATLLRVVDRADARRATRVARAARDGQLDRKLRPVSVGRRTIARRAS